MIDPAQDQRLSRDDRDELAAAASAAARHNRPAHLVAASAVLLIGAMAMAGSAMMSRQAAERSLKRFTAENVRATALIERINEIRAQERGGADARPGTYDPITNILQNLSELARESNITAGVPREASRPSGAFTRREYAYTFTCGSTEDLFRWIRRVGEGIPGMQVLSIALTPVAQSRTWTVSLTFARLERTGN